jgi:hypothetical protein
MRHRFDVGDAFDWFVMTWRRQASSVDFRPRTSDSDQGSEAPHAIAGPVLRSGHAAGCLSALGRAFLHVRLHTGIGAGCGLAPLECRRLHQLIWAVQHIPRGLQIGDLKAPDYAVRGCWQAREAFASYDATWGPSSEPGRALTVTQGFSPVRLLAAYVDGRARLRAPFGAAFRLSSDCPVDARPPHPRACLAVLDQAIKVAALGFFQGRERGLCPRASAQIHAIMDAVHNIPTALREPGNSWWTAARLRPALAHYDSIWGPSSAFGQQHSEHFVRPVSLLRTYETAEPVAFENCSPRSSPVETDDQK